MVHFVQCNVPGLQAFINTAHDARPAQRGCAENCALTFILLSASSHYYKDIKKSTEADIDIAFSV